MVLLFNDFPPPLFHPENVFSTLFPGSVFTPASLLHNSQVRRWVYPGVSRIVGWGEGLVCRVWPTLIIMGRTQPTDILNYSQSKCNIWHLLITPNAQSWWHCPDIVSSDQCQDTQERAQACVTCGPGQPGVVTSSQLWLGRQGGRTCAQWAPASCYHGHCHHQRCYWHCHTWPPGLGTRGPMSQAI